MMGQRQPGMAMDTAYARDVGGRAEQQDQASVLVARKGGAHLLLVADGMGGHQGGATASQTALKTAERLWDECAGRPADPADLLERIFHETHAALASAGSSLTSRPGTTLVLLFCDGQQAYWAHCGDSRLYHFEGTTLLRRTRDHTRVQHLVDAGMIGEDEMATHPQQNQLLQALGVIDPIHVDHGNATLTKESRFLLCSDGFWEQIRPDEMAALLDVDDLSERLPRMVAEAARRGGPSGDNVAAAALRPDTTPARGDHRRRTILLGLLLLAALSILFWPLD